MPIARPQWLRDLDRAVDSLADTHRRIHGDRRQEKLPLLFDDFRGPKPGLTIRMHASGTGDLVHIVLVAILQTPAAPKK